MMKCEQSVQTLLRMSIACTGFAQGVGGGGGWGWWGALSLRYGTDVRLEFL